MASVLVPVLYLLAIFGGLFVFGKFYMGRNAAKGAEPFFPRHVERDIYVTLLGMNPPAPDALLKAALIRRAITDVHRILRIREDKPAIQQLLQKGLVGEDLWSSILAAEKELETEILEVQGEANTFAEGWGTWIFQSAGEMANAEKIQAVFKSVPKMRGELEVKYNRKLKGINASALPPGIQLRTAPGPAARSSVAPSSAPSSPAPVTPKSLNSTLAPPSGAESTFSGSENDSVSPTSPSKSASKKSKKRK